MAINEDLNNLRELLILKDCINLTDKNTRERYNNLIDWATYKYWKVGISKIVNNETSISKYYMNSYTKPFILEKGKYIFLPMCFGNIYIYFNGSMIELGSGNIKNIDENSKILYNEILKYFNIDFIRFIYFRDKWIIDDVFSRYFSPTDVIKYSYEKDINVVPYTFIEIYNNKIFNEDDYNNFEVYFLDKMKGFYPSAICYIKEGSDKRYIIDFFKTTYVYIDRIELKYIDNNFYIPELITKSKKNILIKDIDHLIQSRVKIKSFAMVKKKYSFSMLDFVNLSFSSESVSESLNRIIECFGDEYFINGKYLSKVHNNTEIMFLSDKIGIKKKCKTLKEFIEEINIDKNIKSKILSVSTFEIIRECLEYPKKDFITLVNNMIFDIEDSKVKKFKLENINCLDNPNISVIYRNFNNFISLFNILIDAKKKIQGS
ncbi:DNA polymerase processivity factor [Brazilian porcupinepox virus 1]|nr:DNA polymerase processivity factor [Brazilian porcupinepox virus 1]